MPEVNISKETYEKVVKSVEAHTYYGEWPIEDIIESLINLGLYAKAGDGFDGSVHFKKGGDFGINC